MTEHIDYIELPGGDLSATKSFYATAFGWGFTDYGPTYAGFEDALARVEAAGGTITAPIFEFPGGRRFHFRDPRRQRTRRLGRVNRRSS